NPSTFQRPANFPAVSLSQPAVSERPRFVRSGALVLRASALSNLPIDLSWKTRTDSEKPSPIIPQTFRAGSLPLPLALLLSKFRSKSCGFLIFQDFQFFGLL
ncbi:MAG: hypothetical protein ACP5FQ_07980, partial [Thermoplasmata archaeon]